MSANDKRRLVQLYENLEAMTTDAFCNAYPRGDRWVDIIHDHGKTPPARTPGRTPGHTAAGEPYSCSLPGCVAPCQHGGQP